MSALHFASGPRARGLLAALLIAAVAALVYARSFTVPFVFDDVDAILNNRNVRQLWPPSVSMSAPRDLPVAGRPLVSLSLAVNYAFGEYRVAGYHFFNLLVHALNGWLLFALVRRLARSAGLALAVALAWVAHPLISEAVVYVVQRTELMVSAFALMALFAAARGFDSTSRATSRRGAWHALAAAACAGAALCKENAVAVPLLVLLLDRALAGGTFRAALARHRWLHAGCFASWGIVAWSVLSGARARSVGADLGVSSLDYLATQAGVILWYLRSVFVPTGLSISHDWPVAGSLMGAWPQMLAVALLLGAALVTAARRPTLALPALGPFLLLAPSSSLVPIVTEVAAERRMYLPLAGVLVLVALGLRALWRRAMPPRESLGTPRWLPAGLAAVAITALGAATYARVAVWTDPVALWADAVSKNPDNATAHNNLAKAYEAAGRPDDARAEYLRTVELKPNDARVRHNFGMTLVRANELDAAVPQFEEAHRLDPTFAGPLHNLGTIANLREDWPRAIERFEQALACDPAHLLAHVNLAFALEQVERLDEARGHLEAARDLERANADTHYALGLFRARRGDWAGAAAALDVAVRLAPGRDDWRRRATEARERATSRRE